MTDEMNIMLAECASPLIPFRWSKFELVVEANGEDDVQISLSFQKKSTGEWICFGKDDLSDGVNATLWLKLEEAVATLCWNFQNLGAKMWEKYAITVTEKNTENPCYFSLNNRINYPNDEQSKSLFNELHGYLMKRDDTE